MQSKGIIVVDKEAGWTSHDVVARMRGILRTRRVGHAGTLDPMATGVLPIFFGRATRAVEYAQDQGKQYIAQFVTGYRTNTLDITGNIIETFAQKTTAEDIRGVLPRFTGRILQTPPMYSAKKVDGRKLYELARKGETVEIKPSEIVIAELVLLSCDEANNRYTIRVSCSKGTYIRTLCDEIGKALGCGAVMSELRRTRHGLYEQKDARTVAELASLAEAGQLHTVVRPLEELFSDHPSLVLDTREEALYKCGIQIERPSARDGLCAVYNETGVFLALGRIINQDGRRLLTAEKNFYDTEQRT